MTDSEALKNFVNKQDEAAFDTLVNRYIGITYSICLRLLNENTHDAEDACQATFLLLSQKASAIKAESLPAWLHNTARFVAISTIRTNQRRQQREIEAMQKKEKLSISPESEQESLDDKTLKNIDEAISCLNEKQQTAVIMHYLQGCSREEVAKKLDCSVDAIRKRLDCSLKKMHRFLLRRGTSCSCVALGIGLQNIAAPATPSGLAASCQALGHTVLSTATGAAINQSIYLSAKGALKIMMWNKIKTVAVAAVVITTVATGASQLPQNIKAKEVNKVTPVIQKKPDQIVRRPIDAVFTKDQKQFDEFLGKIKVQENKKPPQLDRNFLREIELKIETDSEMIYEYNSEPDMDNTKPDDAEYTVEYLPHTSPQKCKIKPLAIGVSQLTKPTTKQMKKIGSGQAFYNFIKYFSLNGIPLPHGVAVDIEKKLFVPKYYDINNCKLECNNNENIFLPSATYIGITSPEVTIVFNAKEKNKTKIIGSYIFDVLTKRKLASCLLLENKGDIFINKFDLNLHHPAQLFWILDILDSSTTQPEIIDIPIKKGVEADFGSVFVKIMSNVFDGAFFRRRIRKEEIKTNMTTGWKRDEIVNNEKFPINNVIVGITPACMQKLTTFQFLNEYKKPADEEKRIDDQIGLLTTLPLLDNMKFVHNNVKYLRIRKYSKVKRLVMNLGFLPGTPKDNDNVKDLLDVKIPYVFIGKGNSMSRQQIACSQVMAFAQVNTSGINPMLTYFGWNENIIKYPNKVKYEYYNITPRKLLQALYLTKYNPARIAKIDTNDGTIYMEKGKPAKAAKKVVSNKIPAITTLQPGVISRLELRKRMLLASRKIQNKKYLPAAKILEELLTMKVIADPKAEFPLMPTEYRMEARFWIGQCYLHLGKKDKAQSIYQAMLKEDPKNKWAKFAADCKVKEILAPEIRKEEVEVF